MKTIIATLLAGAAGASFAAAPTANLNHDAQTYQSVTHQAQVDYQAAAAKCNSMSGNAKDVCLEEARANRAHAQADAIANYTTSRTERNKARIAAEESDYALAKARCGDQTGGAKDTCLHDARVEHATRLADIRAGREPGATAVGSSTTAQTAVSTTTTTTAVAPTGAGAQPNTLSADKAAAMEACKNATGDNKTACLIDNGKHPNATAAREKMANAAANAAVDTKQAASRAAEKTKDVAAVAAQKTRDAAAVAADKTRDAAHDVAARTENATDRAAVHADAAADRAAANTREATATAAQNARVVGDKMAEKTDVAANKAGDVVEDSVITSRVKADLVKEPNLRSLGIHVKTEDGIVMLSGFVNNKAEASRAVEVAKSVKGVSKVESALKVK
jgi:osmotically-inducible protein OsmY